MHLQHIENAFAFLATSIAFEDNLARARAEIKILKVFRQESDLGL